jgi:hypothetical protein
MTVIEQAYAIREAMDVAGATLTDEKALECVRLYKPWEVGRVLAKDEFLTYGVNSVGDPQLYKVVIEHTAQADWTPDTSPSLFTPIGLDDDGYPVWSQPTGSHDAYNKGDIVNYNGKLYMSLIDGNTYSPDAYPAGWEVYTE